MRGRREPRHPPPAAGRAASHFKAQVGGTHHILRCTPQWFSIFTVMQHPPVYFQNIPSPKRNVFTSGHAPLTPQPLNTTNPAAPRRVGGAAHRAAPAPGVSPGLLTCGACRPLLGRVTFPCADGPRSVCPSPADGHWMAVRRNATVQTCIQVSVWTCFRRPGVGISQEWNGLVAVATLCNW